MQRLEACIKISKYKSQVSNAPQRHKFFAWNIENYIVTVVGIWRLEFGIL